MRSRAALILAATAALAAADAAPAEDVVPVPGAGAGLCVVLGDGDGKLTARLGRNGRLLVHGLTDDPKAADAARARIRSEGLYGRVSVEHGSYRRLPYAANLVNLVVAEDFPGLVAGGLVPEEIFRVLAPRGAVCLGLPDPNDETAAGNLEKKLKDAGFERCETVGEKRRWLTARKPVPKEMWAGCPVSLQWMARPGGGGAVSAGGRIFREVGRPPAGWKVDHPFPEPDTPLPEGRKSGRCVIAALDAHNGVVLWTREWKSSQRRGPYLEADGDRLFFMQNGKLTCADAATGEIVRAYDDLMIGSYRARGGVLYLTTGRKSENLRAIDPETGKTLWESTLHHSLLADGMVFGVSEDGGTGLVCLDAGTGKRKWRQGNVKGTIKRYGDGILVLVAEAGGKDYETEGTLYALSAEDGRYLWERTLWLLSPNGKRMEGLRKGKLPAPLTRPYYDSENIYVMENHVWVNRFDEKPNDHPLRGKVYRERRIPKKLATPYGIPMFQYHGRDPYNIHHNDTVVRYASWTGLDRMTGEERRRFEYPGDMIFRSAGGCWKGDATARFIMATSGSCMDVRKGSLEMIPASKGACGIGYHFGEGLAFCPGSGCRCRPQGAGSSSYMVVAPLEWEGRESREELEEGIPDRGPAFGRAAARDAAVTLSISSEQHLVEAKDPRSKKALWSFTVGGRVDDNCAVVSDGIAVIGCRDGYVYALRADTGQLVWRLRLAPRERRVVVDGQLESAWPIRSKRIAVANGVIYALAGYHSEFDGGLVMYALTRDDGKVLWRRQMTDRAGSGARGGPAIYRDVCTGGPLEIRPDSGEVAIVGTHWRYAGGHSLGGRTFDLKTGGVKPIPDGALITHNHEEALDPQGKQKVLRYDAGAGFWKEREPGVLKDD